MHWGPSLHDPASPEDSATTVRPYTPYLAPDVAATIAAEIRRCHPHGAVETAWCGKWDAGHEWVTSARLLFRGHNTGVPLAGFDVRAGEVHIHNHGVNYPRFPSEQDIHVARELADIGAGMLIVSWDCTDGYLVRPPLASRKITPPRIWSFGRFTLLMDRT